MSEVEGRIYIEDVERGQWSPGKVEQKVKSRAKGDGYDVEVDIPQDPGQAGKAQVSAFARLLHGFKIRSSPETGSKEDRAKPLAAQVEAGNVYLVRGPWNDAFVNEAAMFPAGQYKDQIDAASRAYHRIIRKKPKSTPVGGEVVR